MELIDRYLQSVKSMLPRKQQEDVVRELNDEILSRVEEKEEALGHPLSEDEQADVLKQMGHPVLVASRYRTQRYLINPATFAIYWMVLRLILAVVFISMAISAVAVAASGQGLGKALGVILRYPMAALSVFAWVTTVFVILEIVQVKFNFFGKWDPRTLPKLNKAKSQPSMLESIVGLMLSAIFGIWWLVGLKHQFWIFGPGIVALRFGPVWQTIYPLFVVLVVFSIIRCSIDVARPGWERGRTWVRLIFRVLNLLVLYFLYNATDIFVPGTANPPNMAEVLKGINSAMHLGVLAVGVITLIQMGQDIYQLIRDRFDGGERVVASFFF
jgi:hypothetical protein